jgi:hypothetical protein
MNSHDLNREARRNVELELQRRGAAVTSRGTRTIRLHASNLAGTRSGEIRVKAKRKGNWHTTVNEGAPRNSPLNGAQKFWVFVDLGSEPRYWIVPEVWIRNDIHIAHQQSLNRHGGHRAKNDDSNHHAISETRLEQWQDAWNILGIF